MESIISIRTCWIIDFCYNLVKMSNYFRAISPTPNVNMSYCFLQFFSVLFVSLCFQLLDSDQELYKNFPLVISERWQQEVAETVYEAVNSDTDKNEARKRAKNKQQGHEEGEGIVLLILLTDLQLHYSHSQSSASGRL